jgi:hypothetical protein
MAIKLTKQQQQIVIGGAIGLAAFLFCYVKFFWMPISSKTTEVKAKIESRSEERRVGKECRRLCRSRWSPYH